MKRRRLTLSALIKKNKEEIMQDSAQLKKIEKRIDDRILKAK
ncbi:FbpB family small basic protein [Bacillus sp. Bva_UNVM-123]